MRVFIEWHNFYHQSSELRRLIMSPPANQTHRNISHATATATATAGKLSFSQFYQAVFLPEHANAVNVGLHVFGTLAGLAYLGWIAYSTAVLGALDWKIALPLLLLFPVIHAVPGLIGHRLLERNASVGDVRVTRKDYSPLWFIVANHIMTFELMLGRLGPSLNRVRSR
jgi:hypothetical protein